MSSGSRLSDLRGSDALAGAPGQGSSVELRNGRIVDVIGGRYHPPGTSLVVGDGKIEALRCAEGEPAAPPAGRLVDLEGRAVLPGLFNTHAHLQIAVPTTMPRPADLPRLWRWREAQTELALAQCAERGITCLRDAWTSDLREQERTLSRLRQAGVPLPRVQQAVVVGPLGGYLSERRGLAHRLSYASMKTPFLPYDSPRSGVVAFPLGADLQTVRDAVRQAVEVRGARCIKIGEQRENLVDFKPDLLFMSLAQMEALVDEARRLGVPTTVHVCQAETFRRAVSCGVTSLAHLPIDGRLSDADATALLGAGTVVEPTLSVAYAFSFPLPGHESARHPYMSALCEARARTSAQVIGEHWVPQLQEPVRAGLERASRADFTMLGLIDRTPLVRQTAGMVTNGFDSLRLLCQRGAVLALGNDAGMPPATAATIGLELALLDLVLNRLGGEKLLGPAAAVRLATIGSAKAMGLNEHRGSIEPGKAADLAILDGDPLADPGLLGRPVAALFIDGRLALNRCRGRAAVGPLGAVAGPVAG